MPRRAMVAAVAIGRRFLPFSGVFGGWSVAQALRRCASYSVCIAKPVLTSLGRHTQGESYAHIYSF